MKLSAVFSILVLATFSCGFPKFQNPNESPLEVPDYAVVFNEVDDFATLVINGKEVFQNERIHYASDDPIIVDIKSHLRVGNNTIAITLTDTPKGQCLNNTWNINFDIYSGGELYEYWQQRDEKGECEDGVKVEKEYTLTLTGSSL